MGLVGDVGFRLEGMVLEGTCFGITGFGFRVEVQLWDRRPAQGAGITG